MTEPTSDHPHEQVSYPPPADLAAGAVATAELYEEAASDRLAFWGRQARELLTWDVEPTQVLDWSDAPFARWFADGKLNAAANCVDRHVAAGNGDRVAFHWVGEPGDTVTTTYADLHAQVQRAANALTDLGVRTGDRVAIYLPMVPEAVVAMLACARIGAPHSVVFSGFSAQALRDRVDDARAVAVITSDGGYRRGEPAPLKPAVDAALEPRDGVESTVRAVLVVQRTKGEVAWTEGRDHWWHEALEAAAPTHEPVGVEAEHPLFVLYTSGSTGKPKGILHTTGGYLTQAAYTHRAVFDLHPESDVYWCGADIGWVTGHTYIVYGPLLNGTTSVMYEGTPNTPTQDRWWQIVEQHGVTKLYTAPTTIRTFMKWGEELVSGHDLSTLQVLGSVGEPINPEAWTWYRRVIGSDRTPVVDTWWQTETGGIMISALPGVTSLKPGSAQVPLPGIGVEVVDDEGRVLPAGHEGAGYLVLTEPWPGMLRGIWGDEERFRDTYWSRFAKEGWYFAGDGARRDADGDVWLLGRVDDVMNVSGHRISTTEVESALVSHPAVAEAAVVGASDPTTGQGIVAFVILRESAAHDGGGGDIARALRDHVAREISPIAKPRQVMVVSELPKTRSGKIMRRLLRDVAEDRQVGDVTTLADSSVMATIQAGLQGGRGSED